MSYLDGLPDALGTVANVLTDKWVDDGVAALNSKVIPGISVEVQPIAQAVADRLAASKDVAQSVTHAGFVTIANYLALGATEDARLVFLASQASFDDRQGALIAAMRAATQAGDARSAAWASLQSLVLDILQVAGKAAVPILLSMAMSI